MADSSSRRVVHTTDPSLSESQLDALPASPRWGPFTKFLVSLILVVVAGAVLVRFQRMIAPLVFAVILTYLLRPVVAAMVARTRLSWHAAVAVLYLAVIVLLIGLLTAAGIAIVQQMQGLLGLVTQIASSDLPNQLQHLLSAPFSFGPFLFDLSRPFTIGPFRFDISNVNWQPLLAQILAGVQPALSQTGTVISDLAGRTAESLGWMLFILIISFYLLFDTHRLAGSFEGIVPPDYAYDAKRLVGALLPIWNAFLRGQITLALIMGSLIGITMTILGVRYGIVLGLLGGMLQFIPIVGPLIYGTTAVAIVLFQPGVWLGFTPLVHAIIVLADVIVLQEISDNILVPRILGSSLHLHPVAILVFALIMANLAGLVGLLLSAPTLATLRLFGSYIYCKLFDLNPWPDPQPFPHPAPERTWARWVRRRWSVWREGRSRIEEVQIVSVEEERTPQEMEAGNQPPNT
jgi:predicted PurR-regulated permease PerM